MKQAIYYVCLLFIITLSFFTVSTIYSGYFNSDTAVQVLQAADFDFKKDLYYWGQKRLGGLIPMVGYILHKTTMLSPLYATSIVNYIILILCFFIFSTFLKSKLLKIGLALVIFLPAIHFKYILLLGHPYGPQLLCIGLVIWYVQKWPALLTQSINFKSLYLNLALPLLLATLSIWISDYSVIFLSFIFLNFTLKHYKDFIALPSTLRLKIASTIVISIVIGALFIRFAKLFGDGHAYGNYPLWVEWETLKMVFTIHFIPYMKFLLFESNNMLIPLVLLAGTILFLSLSFYCYKNARDFLILTLLSIVPAIFSYWVGSSGWAGRYFTPAYFFFWLTLLVTIDTLTTKKNKIALTIVLLILISMQSIPIIQFELSTKSEIKRLSKFNQLGDCGIIGDYWASYNIEAANFPTIRATPNEYTCRSYPHAYKVLQKDTIYLIRNNWFDVFPDTIRIFDVSLRKVKKSEQSIEEFSLAKYTKTN